MATKQEMLEAAIDLLAEIRNDGPNVLALCHKIRLMAGPNDGGCGFRTMAIAVPN